MITTTMTIIIMANTYYVLTMNSKEFIYSGFLNIGTKLPFWGG